MKTLMLRAMYNEDALDMLGDSKDFFLDNGEMADGDAWLPFEAVTGDEANAVVDAGCGEFVEALWLHGTEEIAKHIQRLDLLDEALRDDPDAWYSAIDEWAYNNNRYWAHFGKYVCDDEILVIAQREGGY